MHTEIGSQLTLSRAPYPVTKAVFASLLHLWKCTNGEILDANACASNLGLPQWVLKKNTNSLTMPSVACMSCPKTLRKMNSMMCNKSCFEPKLGIARVGTCSIYT